MSTNHIHDNEWYVVYTGYRRGNVLHTQGAQLFMKPQLLDFRRT